MTSFFSDLSTDTLEQHVAPSSSSSTLPASDEAPEWYPPKDNTLPLLRQPFSSPDDALERLRESLLCDDVLSFLSLLLGLFFFIDFDAVDGMGGREGRGPSAV